MVKTGRYELHRRSSYEEVIGHFVTVFGYMYLAEEDNFVLMFTDSDDYLNQMRNFKVLWNDNTDPWDIQGVYSGWYLEYVVSLDTD